MGTRCLTIFMDGDEEIAVMYRQFDGYPDGHGQELRDFVAGGKIVNGIQVGDPAKAYNGPGCLAASIVAHFKEEAGNFYLYPAGTRDCGEEYRYTLVASSIDYNPRPGAKEYGEIGLRVESGYKDWETIYDGPLDEFDGKAVQKAEQEEE